jgi:hypothetical protein
VSQASRLLGVGDWCLTDYNGPGPLVRTQIVAVDRSRLHGHSQSGVMFQVRPLLKHGTVQTWYCADWFEPVLPNETPNV